jgi:hypothetical protein
MTKTNYSVGDINSKAKGSGARANSGKISFAITPLPLLAGCARVWMSGLLKYAPWNWAKGMKWSVPFDCLCRHLFKWWYLGEDIDAESGEHHLDLVFCNLFMLKHYTKTYTEGDDRPPGYADFTEWLEDFNTPFDEAAFLERNPDIAKLVKERRVKEADESTEESTADLVVRLYREEWAKELNDPQFVANAVNKIIAERSAKRSNCTGEYEICYSNSVDVGATIHMTGLTNIGDTHAQSTE